MRRMQDIYGLPGGKTADGLVSYARAMTGSPYWKGAFGQTDTLGLLNHSRWDHPEEFDGAEYLDDLGKRVFDDTGLIKGYRAIPDNIDDLGRSPLVSYTALRMKIEYSYVSPHVIYLRGTI